MSCHTGRSVHAGITVISEARACAARRRAATSRPARVHIFVLGCCRSGRLSSVVSTSGSERRAVTRGDDMPKYLVLLYEDETPYQSEGSETVWAEVGAL